MRRQGCAHGRMRLSLSPSGPLTHQPLADLHTSPPEVPALVSAAPVRRREEEEEAKEDEAEALARFMMQMQTPLWNIIGVCNECGERSIVLELDEVATAQLISILAARRNIQSRKRALRRWLTLHDTTSHKWNARNAFLRSNRLAARYSEGMTTKQLILALNALRIDDSPLPKLQELLESLATNKLKRIDKSFLFHGSIIPLFTPTHALYVVVRQASDGGWYLVVCNGGAGKRYFHMTDEEDVSVFYSHTDKVLQLFKLCARHWDEGAILTKVGDCLRANFTRLDSTALRAGIGPDDFQLAPLHEPFVGFKIVTAKQTVGNCCVHNLLLALQVVYLGYERIDGNYENLQRYIIFQERILGLGQSKLQSLKHAVAKRSNITTYDFVMGTISAQQVETQRNLATFLPSADAAQAG